MHSSNPDDLKNISPLQVLLFTVFVLALLLPISLFSDKGTVKIFGVPFRFLSSEKLFNPTKKEKKDITKIIQKVDTLDLNRFDGKSDGNLGAPGDGKFSADAATEIYLSDLGRNNLARFFEKLSTVAEKKEKISIFHYGDSQIEGDRMTGYFRQRVQNQFGGNGPGLIPTVNVYKTMTFIQNCSENFERYTAFWGEKLPSRKYGALFSVGTFKLDSLKNLAGEPTTAWIEIEPSKGAYTRAREYNNVTMYYNSCTASCMLKVLQNGKVIHEDTLVTDGAAHEVKLSFPSKPGKLRYVFSSKKSPVISGFCLEGDYGVQVHNVAMRGSSGTQFGSVDYGLMKRMHDEQNTELFILQFGGNSMPGMKDSSSVRGYVRSFKSQVNIVQKMRPEAAVIVVGPSDMSILNDGEFVTYPLLPYLVDQMKKMSLEMGCGYYDIFGVMGGKNSMPSWVEQGLAARDYIHFTGSGVNIVAQLFFDAFIAEYAKWEQLEKAQ